MRRLQPAHFFLVPLLRIAVNTRFLLPELEGFGWYTHEIVRRMVLAHPEDEFIFLFDRPFDPRFIYAPNVTPVVLPPRARFAPLFYAWFEWSVRRALRRYRAEVFFSPDSMCSLSSEVPVLMTCHDLAPLHAPQQIPWIHRAYFLHFLPRFLRRADHVITVSEFVKQDIVTTCGLPAEQVSVVYNGCRAVFQPLTTDEQTQVRAEFSGGQPYFFYAGAIHPRKNIARLIRAFDRFKKKTGAPHQLLLAGRFAWKTEKVSAAFEDADHRADISLLGYISENNLARLTASATALTYISLNEGFGLPMLEAMYCDTPVLAANATCLPEIAGNAALLVDPLSESDIAEGLEKLALNPELARRLIENGRKQRLHFSWDTAATQIYSKLLQMRDEG